MSIQPARVQLAIQVSKWMGQWFGRKHPASSISAVPAVSADASAGAADPLGHALNDPTDPRNPHFDWHARRAANGRSVPASPSDLRSTQVSGQVFRDPKPAFEPDKVSYLAWSPQWAGFAEGNGRVAKSLGQAIGQTESDGIVFVPAEGQGAKDAALRWAAFHELEVADSSPGQSAIALVMVRHMPSGKLSFWRVTAQMLPRYKADPVGLNIV